MKAIIVKATSQAAKVERLVRHCKRLDGTEVVVIPADDSITDYPLRNNKAFTRGCEAMAGEPFFWLEPDAIPTKPGWLGKVAKEWAGLPKTKVALLSSDHQPGLDLIGGIGVYGNGIEKLIPDSLAHHGWDGYLLQHHPDKVAFSPLIQHCYGDYSTAPLRPLSFPQDNHHLRPDAVIFHRDVSQTLIPTPLNPAVFHTGDIGDIVAFLPVLRQLGKCKLIIGGNCGNRTMKGPRLAALRSLLEAQPYIEEVVESDDTSLADINMTDWRRAYLGGRTLTESQAGWVGVKAPDMAPWLNNVPKITGYEDKVIINCTPRYRVAFPWSALLKRNKGKVVFLGMKEEHEAFQHSNGACTYVPTPTYMEAAAIIGSCRMFVGNQSSLFWVAAGLGAPLTQLRYNMDSTVPRENAVYWDGFKTKLPV